MSFKPFADDATSLTIGEFTVENGTDAVAFYGNLQVTRDKAGLQLAVRAKAALDAVVDSLRAEPSLPEKVAHDPTAVSTVPNPLA